MPKSHDYLVVTPKATAPASKSPPRLIDLGTETLSTLGEGDVLTPTFLAHLAPVVLQIVGNREASPSVQVRSSATAA